MMRIARIFNGIMGTLGTASLPLLFVMGASSLPAVDRITANVALTNTAYGTSNYMTITVNGNVRTWTNNVVVASTQILTNSTPAGSKTNLYNQIALNPFSQVVLQDAGSTNISLVGASGVDLTVTVSAEWATVTYSTQAVTSLIGVRVPISGEASGGQATNIASLLVKGQNDLSTNSFYENSTAVVNLLGNTNAQFVLGLKIFTNAAGQWFGIVSNSPAISGTVVALTNGQYYAPYVIGGVVSNAAAIGGTVKALTNGVWWNGFLASPTLTNGVNYGNAFRSPGSGTDSEQFGLSASATNSQSLAVGNTAISGGASSTAVGAQALATSDNTTAIGTGAISSGTSATAIGSLADAEGQGATAFGASSTAINAHSAAFGENATTTADHQLMFGTSSEYAHFPGAVRIDGNTELTWKRYANSSLANGNNAAVTVGTNTFMEVSGPSSAFTINGIAGGRDGKFLIILNQTGQNMTIAHDSGVDPTAANRIYTMTGADRATTANGAAMLIYSGNASRWILISLDP